MGGASVCVRECVRECASQFSPPPPRETVRESVARWPLRDSAIDGRRRVRGGGGIVVCGRAIGVSRAQRARAVAAHL